MSGGSTLPRRALGRRLRHLRLAAGKSLLAAGVAIDISKQGIGRLEEGMVVRISTVQYRALLDFYRADEDAKAEIMGLVKEVRATQGDASNGWWRAYADVVNPRFNHFVSLEQDCSRMTSFQLTLLSGLLQTPAYRRWVVRTGDPAMSSASLDRHIELTARRQRKLVDDPEFSLEVLLSESVLRHQVGGNGVMAEQLSHLLAVASRPTVSIRVIPFDSGEHPGLVFQSFVLMEFPPSNAGRTPEPSVVFVETFTGGLFVEDSAAVDRYRATLAALRDVALTEEDSVRFIEEIAGEYIG
ncbi:DUF5753 domain-containing protein [Nocardia sp. BMG51109]|uniref:DUF5753 domain-containing protein n=1 Tax=Nocardia sp. BMG51109 TaxID=1056816 RepID=UPI000A047BF8|nr:DUF5753 domain-containing protein [Nocardia sp. BMG51109]